MRPLYYAVLLVLAVGSLMGLVIYSHGEPKNPTLSPKELTEIRNEQLEYLRAQIIVQKPETQLAIERAMQTVPEYKRFAEVRDKLQKTVDAVFISRKIKTEDWALCDGPGAAPCEKVAAGEIALRPQPKKDAGKK